MAAKKNSDTEPKQSLRSFLFPTLGLTIQAATYKEALKEAKRQQKAEESDVES